MSQKLNQDTPKPKQNDTEGVKNPYRTGTKKYQVAKMMFSGEEDTEKMSKELGVKLGTIWNVRSELVRGGYLTRKGKSPSSSSRSQPPTPPASPKADPVKSAVKPEGEVSDEVHQKSEGSSEVKTSLGEQKTSPGEANKLTGEEGEAYKMMARKVPKEEDDGRRGYPGIRDDMERILFVEATPILRKVALNPKVYLWYDYAKTRLNYQGDVGDFLIDAVEDFWRSRGYKIVISQEKEVEMY